MGSMALEPHEYFKIFKFVVLIAILQCCVAFPTADEERYYEREVANSGVHQLASWLAAQLRRSSSDFAPQEISLLPYRLPLHGKRNSELTSSIMSIPRTMIDNGK